MSKRLTRFLSSVLVIFLVTVNSAPAAFAQSSGSGNFGCPTGQIFTQSGCRPVSSRGATTTIPIRPTTPTRPTCVSPQVLDIPSNRCVTPAPPPPTIAFTGLIASSYDSSDTRTYGGDINQYSLSFRLDNGSLAANHHLRINFPSSFDLSGYEIASISPGNLSAVPSSTAGVPSGFVPPSSIELTASSVVPSGTTISLVIDAILNGPAGDHAISISSPERDFTNSPSRTVRLDNPPADPPPAGDAWDNCSWRNIKACFIALVDMLATAVITVLVNVFVEPVVFVYSVVIDILGGFIVKISISVTNFILTETFRSINDSSSPARQGFGIAVGIANIGFVIAIIIIGFATILHKESYAMKKAIPQLLISAVLINFSFLIAVQFVSLSNSLSSVFLSEIQAFLRGNPFANAINSNSAIFTPDLCTTNCGSPALAALGDALTKLLTPIFKLAFYSIAAFCILALGVMFAIRYVAISILLILLPFVLILRIFPELKVAGEAPWSKWQGEFTKWLIFGPVCMFFTYLAFQIQPGGIAGMILQLGLLVGGMLIASKMGITGGKMAHGIASGAAKGIGKYAVGRPFTAGIGKLGGWVGGKGGAGGTGATAAPGATPKLDLQKDVRSPGPEASAGQADPEAARIKAELLAAQQATQPQTPNAAAIEAELARGRAARLAELQAEEKAPTPEAEPTPTRVPEGPQSRLGKFAERAVGGYNRKVDKTQEMGGKAADWTKNLIQEQKDRAQSSTLGQAAAKATSWTQEKAGAAKAAGGEAGAALGKARGAGAVIRAGKGVGKGLAGYTKFATGVDITKKPDLSKLRENLGKELGKLGGNLEKELFGEHPPKSMFGAMWGGAQHDAGIFKGKKTEDLSKLLEAQNKLVEGTERAITRMEAIAEKDRTPTYARELQELKSALKQHAEKKGVITAKIEQAKAEKDAAHGGSHAPAAAPAGKAPPAAAPH